MNRVIVMAMVLLTIVSCAPDGDEPTTAVPIPAPTDAATPKPTPPAPTPTATPAVPSAPAGKPFQLAFGESIQVEEITIQFEGVTEDSRCPIDVECVWEGQVVVNLNVEGSDAETAQITLSSVTAPNAGFQDYLIEIVGVEPPPGKAGETIASSDYIITLTATASTS